MGYIVKMKKKKEKKLKKMEGTCEVINNKTTCVE